MSFLSKILPLGKSKNSSDGTTTTTPQPSQQAQQPAQAQPDASVPKQKALGSALREDFLFDPKFLNLNHGSFGTYPRVVRDAMRRYQDMVELRPDQFIRYDMPKLINKSRAALAELLHAPGETIVLVQNATTGVNTVLSNLVYEEGDMIVYFDTVYGACEKIIAYLTETTPVESAKVTVKYPISDADLVVEFRRVIEEQHRLGKKVKAALFDTISSLPGLRMPFEELSKACRELGVLSVVDGAHGIGHLHLNLEELDFDFFVSNCHKWLFTPRACAVFYVPIRNQRLIRSTMPTSHGFVPVPKEGQHILNPFEISSLSPFEHNFGFVGTMDNAPYLCVPDALAYRKSIGGEAAIIDYCTKLNLKASKRVAELLGTEVLENEQGTLTNCGMSMVRLPVDADHVKGLIREAGIELEEYDMGVKIRDYLTMTFVREYNTFLALTVLYNDAWWVRLSATVYLDMDDFEWGGKVMVEACEKVQKGDFLASLKKSKGEE